MEPTIVYEDDNVLGINKPSGMMVHGDGRSTDNTLADWIVEQYPDIRNVGEPWISDSGERIARPGIVHRLDKETSGVMIISKNQKTFEYLKEQFKKRMVEKTYNAFVYGTPTDSQGIIDAPIGRHPKDFRQWTAEDFARGKQRHAVTKYTVLTPGKQMSFLEARPHTGRTHQIRVHLKHISHPVVCDSLYAQGRECFGFSRLALHARTISFIQQDDSRLTLEAPLPDEFQKALKSLK